MDHTVFILKKIYFRLSNNAERVPDSKVHEANMGPTWVLSAPGEPHVGPVNLTTRVSYDVGIYIGKPCVFFWPVWWGDHNLLLVTYPSSHYPQQWYTVCMIRSPWSSVGKNCKQLLHQCRKIWKIQIYSLFPQHYSTIEFIHSRSRDGVVTVGLCGMLISEWFFV